jgi:hypothetical protein
MKKYFKSIGLLLILMTVSILSNAQFQRDRSNIFPKYGNYQNKGWVFSPGMTYMMPTFKNPDKTLWVASDSSYNIDYSGKGNMGVMLEIGRFISIENSRIISYIDFSVGAKMLRGKESFEATLNSDTQSNEVFGSGTFSQTYITASINATNTFVLNDEVAMHNSLGLNLDYEFASLYNYDDAGLGMDLATPSDLLLQFHYKLGFGFKASKNLFIIPSVETPLVTLIEYDDLKSTTKIFNARYRPFIFRVTFMLLDQKADRKCPTKNKKRKKSESLFGK